MRRILPCGAGALLVECDDGIDALQLWRRLSIDPPAGVREAVPGARTVLVLCRADSHLRKALLTLPGAAIEAASPLITIVPVRYDGDDLDAVATLARLTPGEVVARHAAPIYTVAFGGFVPGFAYLTGLDPALRLPRRATPRTRVPAGAVAIADEYTGVYPSPTPGGWHLIGTTDLVMFDAAREPAATLRPGMRVRFEAAS